MLSGFLAAVINKSKLKTHAAEDTIFLAYFK